MGAGGRHKAINKANLKRSLRSHKYAISLCFRKNEIKITALLFSRPTQQCPTPRWKARLCRDYSEATPTIPPVTGTQRPIPPIDEPLINEEEIYMRSTSLVSAQGWVTAYLTAQDKPSSTVLKRASSSLLCSGSICWHPYSCTTRWWKH